MRYLWSRFIIVFLLFEAVIFIIYYNYGPGGMQSLHILKKMKLTAQFHIDKLKQENDNLCEQIEAWKDDPFLQEKFARERLALQKEDEIIYFRSKS